MSERKILFLATEDWFFRSHFRHLISAARDEGLRPLFAARFTDAAADIAADGAELRPLPSLGRNLSPLSLFKEARELAQLIKQERPALLHAIALKPCMLARHAAGASTEMGTLFAVTGLGWLGVSRNPVAIALRELAERNIAGAARAGSNAILVENTRDREVFASRGAPADRIRLLPGAGVDLARHVPAPEPRAPPFRIGLAARLIRSKGIDLAVAAIGQLRAHGLDIELHIAGRADPDNPSAHSEAEINAWRQTPGIHCHGWIDDVSAFWRGMHIAIAPSRGGEGLPKSILEAAANARPILTTRTSGCEDFITKGDAGRAVGIAVPPNDASALADALRQLCAEPDRRYAMGAAARTLIERDYTLRHVQDAVRAAWRSMLSP